MSTKPAPQTCVVCRAHPCTSDCENAEPGGARALRVLGEYRASRAAPVDDHAPDPLFGRPRWCPIGESGRPVALFQSPLGTLASVPLAAWCERLHALYCACGYQGPRGPEVVHYGAGSYALHVRLERDHVDVLRTLPLPAEADGEPELERDRRAVATPGLALVPHATAPGLAVAGEEVSP